ncbi:hypothetical protein K438DRAFT_1760266 [Mycena galopus ATCC 62051]|nr:hypothetical protein K438DRAFT_1760266 [Mycena galopus ATCC 62051]
MSSPAVQPVVWYNRGIRSPQLTLKTMDHLIAPTPNVVYTPVSDEETQEIFNAPGPSSTGLMDAPFISVVTFLKIAHQPGTNGRAGVVLKDANQIVGLTPGQTHVLSSVIHSLFATPWIILGCMIFSAAILPPNSLEDDFDMNDPTQHIGMINEDLDIQYLMSYWKKTQV